MNVYPVGTIVRVAVKITAANADVDPATLRFIYRKPDGNLVTLTYGVDSALVKDSVGDYHVDLDSTGLTGFWDYRYVGTGANACAADGEFEIVQTRAK